MESSQSTKTFKISTGSLGNNGHFEFSQFIYFLVSKYRELERDFIILNYFLRMQTQFWETRRRFEFWMIQNHNLNYSQMDTASLRAILSFPAPRWPRLVAPVTPARSRMMISGGGSPGGVWGLVGSIGLGLETSLLSLGMTRTLSRPGGFGGVTLSLPFVGLGLFIPLLVQISEENIGLFRDNHLKHH